jgi:FkbM family methyltransferase
MLHLLTSEVEVIKTSIKSNDVIFDVGAFNGEWSQAVIQEHKNVCVHQFEPMEESFKVLSSLFVEGCKTNKIFQNNLALSDVRAKVKFYYYPFLPVLSTKYRRPKYIEDKFSLKVRECEVNTTTLDLYCEEKEIQKIDFLKIDAEGSELAILKGASSLLKEGKVKNIQFEYGACFYDAGITFEQVWLFLHSFDFIVFEICSDKLKCIEKPEDFLTDYSTVTGNCLAMRKK